MIAADVNAQPNLIVSCYGGAAYFTMTDDLEREFMDGIGQVAATKGQSNIKTTKIEWIFTDYLDVWLLTTGLNSGVSKLIGQGVHRNALLNENRWESVVIGMSRWGTIAEHVRKDLKKKVFKIKYFKKLSKQSVRQM